MLLCTLQGVLLGVIIIGGGSYLCLQRIKAKKESQEALMRLAHAQDDDSDDDDDVNDSSVYTNDAYTNDMTDYTNVSSEPNTGNSDTFEGIKNNDKESLV